jgi:hypothetical protein
MELVWLQTGWVWVISTAAQQIRLVRPESLLVAAIATPPGEEWIE